LVLAARWTSRVLGAREPGAQKDARASLTHDCCFEHALQNLRDEALSGGHPDEEVTYGEGG
jgi:hypothetical protein